MKTFLLFLRHALRRRKLAKQEKALAGLTGKRAALKMKALKLHAKYEKTRAEVKKFIQDNPL